MAIHDYVDLNSTYPFAMLFTDYVLQDSANQHSMNAISAANFTYRVNISQWPFMTVLSNRVHRNHSVEQYKMPYLSCANTSRFTRVCSGVWLIDLLLPLSRPMITKHTCGFWPFTGACICVLSCLQPTVVGR